MASESVSFRISRTAEDLAQTVAALSRRLVSLEQAVEAMELQLKSHQDLHPQEASTLDRVDRLLLDCRALLEPIQPGSDRSDASDDGLLDQHLAA